MALSEPSRFGRDSVNPPPTVVDTVIARHASELNGSEWLYCGYAPLAAVAGVRPPTVLVRASVDNMFRLSSAHGFERFPVVMTTALRTSRFAAVLFWEVLHVLAPGGLWIDVDETSRCHGTELTGEDYLAREYFSGCLALESRCEHGGFVEHAYRKSSATPIATHIADTGWTFGILTSGESPNAARMAADILALDLPDVEVIFCGPRPANAPDDERARAIDLERPEPRGWITRKKNLLAAAARYENLCLLHDRYVVTPEWADALTGYGPCFAFVTLPQVYHAGVGHRFPQRYPDYQVLNQRQGLDGALHANVYDSERVFHPEYDDFAETAFCCGGLYIAKRSLWTQVRQDEALFHCEWEDVSFGLDCQRRGLPHRVNRLVTAESTAAHPLLLTRRHTLEASGRADRGRLHIAGDQAATARSAPELFKPVIGVSCAQYYETTRRRFNAIPDLEELERLTPDAVAGCTGLSDFWAVIERHVSRLQLTTRDRISEVAFFLADTVYKWPTPQVLSWIRAHEAAPAGPASSARFSSIVGWGTGSAFRAMHRLIGRDLAFVVDSDPATWGSVIDGVTVHPPSALRQLDETGTAVVVFSCFVDAIAARVRREGNFFVVPAVDLVAARRFQPLVDLVAYFQEVERYYPVLFADAAVEAAA